MSELMRASRQWSCRPNDERFWSVGDLRSHCDSLRANSTEKVLKLGELKAHRWLGRYTDASALETEQMIRNAKQYSLGLNHDEVCERVHKLGIVGLTNKAIEAAWNYADKWEATAGATPNTAWGFVHGLTRYSQTVGYTDARQLLDVAGGKILSLAT